MKGSPGMRAPSLLSAILTVSPATRRVVCREPSKLLSSLVEGIRTGNGKRAVGRTVVRCAATGLPCRRIACFRSTWLRLPRPVPRPLRTSEARLARQQSEDSAELQELTTPRQMASDSKAHRRKREKRTLTRAGVEISSRGNDSSRVIRDRAVAAPTTKTSKHTRERSIDRGSSSSQNTVVGLWEASQQACLQTLR